MCGLGVSCVAILFCGLNTYNKVFMVQYTFALWDFHSCVKVRCWGRFWSGFRVGDVPGCWTCGFRKGLGFRV